jgi:hypothetical protein
MTASAVLLVALVFAGCSPATTAGPSVTPIPTSSASASATPTPTRDVAEGTRVNPLDVGESRKISPPSMWSVGAEAPTQVGVGYVVLPVRLDLDWDAARAQGVDPENEGADPWQSLYFSYVTAAGHSYDSNNFPDAEISNNLYDIGTVYPPTTSVSANVGIAVPDAEIAGGVWRVGNANDDAVFIVGAP